MHARKRSAGSIGSLAMLALAGVAAAAPLPTAPQSQPPAARVLYEPSEYRDFQISDGTGGGALAQARAVFGVPADADLADRSFSDFERIALMVEAAGDADVERFGPAIAQATGLHAAALEVGRVKNRVLQLCGRATALRIKIAKDEAAGLDAGWVYDELEDIERQLAGWARVDAENAGLASLGTADIDGPALMPVLRSFE